MKMAEFLSLSRMNSILYACEHFLYSFGDGHRVFLFRVNCGTDGYGGMKCDIILHGLYHETTNKG